MRVFRADIDRLNEPETKLQEQQYSKFLTSAMGQLVQLSLIPNSDPVGQRDFNDFALAARRLWDDGLAAGKTPDDMLNSEKTDYIGKIIPRFKTDRDVKRDAGFGIIDVPPRKTPTPPRMPGETIPTWKRRTQ